MSNDTDKTLENLKARLKNIASELTKAYAETIDTCKNRTENQQCKEMTKQIEEIKTGTKTAEELSITTRLRCPLAKKEKCVSEKVFDLGKDVSILEDSITIMKENLTGLEELSKKKE